MVRGEIEALRLRVKDLAGLHTLRHSFAAWLLRQGSDIRFVEELLGHNDVKKTQIYTYVLNRNAWTIRSRSGSGAAIQPRSPAGFLGLQPGADMRRQLVPLAGLHTFQAEVTLVVDRTVQRAAIVLVDVGSD